MPAFISPATFQQRVFDLKCSENPEEKYSIEIGHGALLLAKGDL